MAALPDLLLRRVQQHPDHIALRGPDAILSYQDLWRAAGAVADQLRNLGVKRIGLCGDNNSHATCWEAKLLTDTP